MKEASIEEARRKLGDIVDRARFSQEATLITRHGKPAALIAPALTDHAAGVIAEAREMVERSGHGSEAGAMIDELLVIIERLTEDDPSPRPKVKRKTKGA